MSKCSNTVAFLRFQGEIVPYMPFSIYQRSGIYYVRFKNEITGKYLPAKSTGTSSKKEAERTAWEWFRNGGKPGDKESGREKSVRQLVRGGDLSDAHIGAIIDEAIRRGIVRSAVMAGGQGDIDALAFCLEFWDFDKSPYARQKKRLGQSLTRAHFHEQQANIRKHFGQFLGGKALGSVTRRDIEAQFDRIGELPYSGHTKNYIMRALLVPLKYAFAHELIASNVSDGWAFFAERYARREILSPEQMAAILSVEWESPQARLGTVLSAVTGMRVGEIRGLQLGDLGDGVIYLRHSWSDSEGLKCPKNGEERLVQVPFRWITDALRDLAMANPYKATMDAFVFWGLTEKKPLDHKVFSKGLRKAMIAAGFTEEDAGRYCFHSLRHFFTAHMYGRVGDNVLQRQTGHKTHAMLMHYADHAIAEQNRRLREAAADEFSFISEAGSQRTEDRARLVAILRGK